MEGVADGCAKSGCALSGGETAEMPGLYGAGDFDVAGFCVGAVRKRDLLPRTSSMQAGDVLIGVASSGVHANGFSLVRKALAKFAKGSSKPAVPSGPSDCDVLSKLAVPSGGPSVPSGPSGCEVPSGPSKPSGMFTASTCGGKTKGVKARRPQVKARMSSAKAAMSAHFREASV